MDESESRKRVLEGYQALSNAVRKLYGLEEDGGNKARFEAAHEHTAEARAALTQANVVLRDTTLQSLIESLNGLPRARVSPWVFPHLEGRSYSEARAGWVDRRALLRVAKRLRAFVGAQGGWGDIYQEIQAIDELRQDSIHNDLTLLTPRNPLILCAIAFLVALCVLIWARF